MQIGSIGSAIYAPATYPSAVQPNQTVLSQYPVQSLPSAQSVSSLRTEFPLQAQSTVLQFNPSQLPPQPTAGQETVLSQYLLLSNYATASLPAPRQQFPVGTQEQAPAISPTSSQFGGLSQTSSTSQQSAAAQFLAQSQPDVPTLGTLLNTTV